MLGNFIYSGDMPANNAVPHKLDKAVRRFLMLAVIFISCGLLWIFAISPCMAPAKTEVKTIPGLSKSRILEIAGISDSATYISINAAEAEWLLSQHYLIESAKVVKRFPDRIAIFLEPRRAVALVLGEINGRPMPVYFDRCGVAFGIGSTPSDLASASLPVVSGVFPPNQPLRLGMKISSVYLPLFSRIGAISDEDPKIWQAISEIGVVNKSNDMFDLIMYPIHDSIKLRMGSEISKDSIYYALLMSDVCRQSGDIPDEIDVRSGLGVRVKETRFGK